MGWNRDEKHDLGIKNANVISKLVPQTNLTFKKLCFAGLVDLVKRSSFALRNVWILIKKLVQKTNDNNMLFWQ